MVMIHRRNNATMEIPLPHDFRSCERPVIKDKAISSSAVRRDTSVTVTESGSRGRSGLCPKSITLTGTPRLLSMHQRTLVAGRIGAIG